MNDAIGSIYQWTADGATVSKYSNLTELLENEYAVRLYISTFGLHGAAHALWLIRLCPRLRISSRIKI